MSNSDSHQKQPPKKSLNSYSLLLKGLSEVEKPNPKSSNSVKKSRTSISSRKESPSRTESSMNRNSKNDNRQESPPGGHASNNDAQGDMDPDIPDRSYGDYYCKLCDSHMNSDNMWEAHITGKRHIKNVKKGDPDTKYEDVIDAVSDVGKEMKNVKDPVVGLSYIHEIRRKEDNVPPIFHCYLCQSSLATIPLVVEHVISMKHRLNYIKEANPEEYQLIEATNLKKGHMEPLVVEAARELEEKFGRGEVKVKKEKQKGPVYTYSGKKSYNLDDDDDFDDDRYQRSYKNSKVDSNSSVWKSVDTGKNYGRRGRSRSPRDFEDTFNSRARSRSPRAFKDRRQDMYSDEEHSMDGYKRPFSKRDKSSRQDDYERHRSFSKSDKSPREDDYHFRSSDDYSHSSRLEKNKQSYGTSRYNESSSSRRYDEPSSSRGYDEPSTSRAYDEPSTSRAYDEPSTSRGYNLPSSSRESLKMPFNGNSLDRQNYSASRYDEISQESLKMSFKDHQKSATMPQENYLPVYQRPVENSNRPKSVEDVLQDILLFSSEDCYRLFYERIKLLPEITQITEMLLLVRLIAEAQKKLKSKLSEQVVAALTEKYLRSEANAAINSIPGLGDVIPSTVSPNIRLDKSANAVDAENFINNIFKSANVFPTSKTQNSQLPNIFKSPSVSLTQSSSYQTPPSISPQQAAAFLSSFQIPPANAQQTPPANSYQATPANSYQAPAANTYQAPPQSSYGNMPFASGSAQNYSLNTNIPNPSHTQKPASETQIFNYSHFSSTSSAPKNYPRKY